MARVVSRESPRWYLWAIVSSCPEVGVNITPITFDCGKQQAWRDLVASEPENLGAWLALDYPVEPDDRKIAQEQLWRSTRLETAPEVLLPPLNLPPRVLEYITEHHPQVAMDITEMTHARSDWGLALILDTGIRTMGTASYFSGVDAGFAGQGYKLGERVAGDLMTARSLHVADTIIALSCAHQKNVTQQNECWGLSDAITFATQAQKVRRRESPGAFINDVIQGLDEGTYREVRVEDFVIQ